MSTPSLPVKHHMTSNPITTSPTATVESVVKVLEEHRISGLPVVDEAGKVVGVISEGDLLIRESPLKPPLYMTFLGSVIYFESPATFHQHLKKSLGMLVQDVMTTKPLTTTPEACLTDVAQLMLERHIKRLPVVDAEHKLVGIITRHDLVRALRSQIVPDEAENI